MKNIICSFLFVLILESLIINNNSVFAQNDAVLRAFFQPLPSDAVKKDTLAVKEKIALGKKLFFETRLSEAKDLSCNSCHNLKTFGVDNEPTSKGHKGQRGTRNSPTVFNAALHAFQFWDGRAKDVEEQALGPILNPVEMAMSADSAVLDRIKSDEEYKALFQKAFPGENSPITFKNLGIAIGTFERTLLTPSRFDEYLNGNNKALTSDEITGAKTFRDLGCIACHNGPAVGGQMFQKLGLVKPYQTKDLGRYEVTKNESDKFIFKVPSLRNVEKTSPYFHDGSVKTLEEAVKLMAEHQLGKTLDQEQTKLIVAFLKSLTGKI